MQKSAGQPYLGALAMQIGEKPPKPAAQRFDGKIWYKQSFI